MHDHYVIGQDSAKKVFSVEEQNHCMHTLNLSQIQHVEQRGGKS